MTHKRALQLNCHFILLFANRCQTIYEIPEITTTNYIK